MIIKLYGKGVGFNFLQSKLNLLWKPTGRIDFVDLGKDFYSVKFSVKEDMNAVLKNGPWFVGGHFLSIHPWEPFFKPDCASVSSIAVWVRFHALPLELYEPKVLKQIGESIGKVLRIDTHTAMEARGRYARLCIQVDLNKPLIDTILIGRFEQPVSYEGLHKLCFSCGRIGHKVETCQYTIKCPEMLAGGSPVKARVDTASDQSTNPRGVHDLSSTSSGSGTTNVREPSAEDDRYGPWMLVSRRKPGNNRTKNAVTPGELSNSGMRQSSLGHGLGSFKGFMGWAGTKSSVEKNGLMRTNRSVEGSGLVRVGLETKIAKGGVDEGPGKTSSPSIKGKKDIARKKIVKILTKSDLAGKHLHNIENSFLSRSIDGERDHDLFQFKADDRADSYHHSRCSGYGDLEADQYVEQSEVLAADSQHKEDEPTVDVTAQRHGNGSESMVIDQPYGDGSGRMLGLEDFASSAQGAKGAKIKGDLALHQGFNYLQSTSRNQHQGHGEGAEFGSARAHIGSALKEGED